MMPTRANRAVLLGLLLWSCVGSDSAMSVARGSAVVVRDRFDAQVDLVDVESVGTEDSPAAFGGIFAAEWLGDRSVIVADPIGKQLVRVPADSEPQVSFGRPGSGPGEFLSISHVARSDSLIFAYDDRQDRLLVFGSDGGHVASAQVGFGLLQGLRGLSGPRVLALRMTYDGDANLLVLGVDGGAVDSLGSGPHVPPAWNRDPYAPAGAICVYDDTVIYANPLASELAAYSIRERRLSWAKRYPNAVRDEIVFPADAPPRARGVLVAVACDGLQIVLTYGDSDRGVLYHDFFTFDGSPIGRHVESQRRGQPYVGAIVAISNDTILAFSNRPIPRFSLHRKVRR